MGSQPAPTVTVGPGGTADLDGVMHVMTAAFSANFGEAWTRSQCAGILPMHGVSLMIAHIDDGRAAGFSLSRSAADEAELLLIAVHPAHRRTGIGRALLRDFVERARSSGVKRVHLEVRDHNPAIGMYRAAGFEPIGRRPNYYRGIDGKQFDAITFARAV